MPVAHVIVVGAGAIGSHVLPHLARSPRVSRLTIIDPGLYEPGSVVDQDVDAHGIGRPKAAAQVRRLRRINPALALHPVYTPVEDVPLGALRSDAILGCLDSRSARMTVGQAARRLGVPFVDARVEPLGMRARVAVYVPGPDAPCPECGWDAADDAALEPSSPGHAGVLSPQPGASSALGALAAALQAIECDWLLTGAAATSLIGRDVLIDVRHHACGVTQSRRNPACRMPDHAGWRIDPFGGPASQTTLGEVLAIGTTLRGAGEWLTFSVAGQRLAMALACAQCGAVRPAFQLERALRRSARRCPACRGELHPVGSALLGAIAADAAPCAALDAPLTDLGLRAGDVFSLATPFLAVHYELGGDA